MPESAPNSYEIAKTDLETVTTAWVSNLSITAKNRLLIALLHKRQFDGMNGRFWDASSHLEWEIQIERFHPPQLTMRWLPIL